MAVAAAPEGNRFPLRAAWTRLLAFHIPTTMLEVGAERR
jgi:hypothetical protein